MMNKRIILTFSTLLLSLNFYAFRLNGIDYQITSENTVSVIASSSGSYSGNISIPATVNYSNTSYSVTWIEPNAFYECTQLKSVSIPEGVLFIMRYAFYGCTGLSSIDLPESLVVIGERAFYNCSALTTINIPKGVKTIDDSSFSGCTSLTSLVLSEGLTSIESFAFYGCSSLTSILLPESITEIHAGAFQNCTGLTSINIPQNITIIQGSTFYGCTELTSIHIPENVTTIGNGAFQNCTGLTSITIPENITSIAENSFEGCSNIDTLYWNSNLTPWYITQYITNRLKHVQLGDKVDNIGYRAFLNCKKLISIVIPKSVKTIYSNAFFDCQALKSIDIPDGVSSIEPSAFKNCYKLASIKIPNSISNIDGSSFVGCSNIDTIYWDSDLSPRKITAYCKDNLKFFCFGNKVQTIGEKAFQDCSRIKTLIISKNINSIASDAFDQCKRIDTLHWNTNLSPYSITQYRPLQFTNVFFGDNVTSIGEKAFFNSTSIESIHIPESVTRIGNNAFFGCSSLTSINLPGSIIYIGESAFDCCSELTSINIPKSISMIENSTFANCIKLDSINIPENVTFIGAKAFYSCTGLSSIEIPSGVCSIGSNAFFNCQALSSLNLNDGIEYIGEGAFNNCTGLTKIIIPESIISIGDGAFANCESLTSINIPENNTSICNGVFSGCTSLTSIKIPEKVTSIGNYAFYNCTSLKSINIPEKVTSIGDFVFYNCSGITSINIPENITSIGNYAFSGCSGLTSIYIPENVTSIGGWAFKNCTGLTSIIIPEKIVSIGSGAFMGCVNIKTLKWNSACSPQPIIKDCSNISTVEIGDNVKTLSTDALKNSQLNTLIIGSEITNIDEQNFKSKPVKTIWLTNTQPSGYNYAEGVINYVPNNNFESSKNTYIYSLLSSMFVVNGVKYVPVSLSDSTCDVIDYIYDKRDSIIIDSIVSHNNTIMEVRNINPYSFFANDSLNYLSLNISKTIGKNAFESCSNLKNVELIGSTCLVDTAAFKDCNNLEDVIIGNRISTIGSMAFSGCTKLESLSLGSKVSIIGDEAFSDCNNITKIKSHTPIPPVCGIQALDDINKLNCILNVPTNSLTSYQTAEQWKDFSNMYDNIILKYKLTYYVDDVEYASFDVIYGDTLKTIQSPIKEGYSFNWSEIPSTMPANDVEVNGTFSINSYILTYKVDTTTYKVDTLNYATAITPLAEPTKEGYTFSGWSEIPATMPANDVEVNGSFRINSYILTYKVDTTIYKVDTLNHATTIKPLAEPTKEGYTFSGWSEIPDSMPANDVEITGSFTINSYVLIYKVDGEAYNIDTLNYATAISPQTEPTKEGYTFSGWSEIPATMPANDVEVKGTFTVNKYLLIVMIDDEVVYSDSIVYGTRLVDYADIIKLQGIDISQWEWYDEIETITMPAHDVTINAVSDAIRPITIDLDESAIFDLTGKKIETDDITTLPAGIYIRNGRKFIIQ